MDDFPKEDVVVKRTQTFEHFFCNFVVKHFKQLTLLDQLLCLCVAIMPDRANQSLSLFHYLRSNELFFLSTSSKKEIQSSSQKPSPINNLNDSYNNTSPNALETKTPTILNSYVDENEKQHNNSSFNSIQYNNEGLDTKHNIIYPTLPGYLCYEVDQLKANLSSEHHVIMCQDLTERVISYLSKTVASELSRIFEYQLSLTQENIALRLLAKFACNNIFEAIRTKGRLLERNSMVNMALNSNNFRKNDEALNPPKWISIISFGKELKWNIYEIFRKPALRKVILDSSNLNNSTHACYTNRNQPYQKTLSYNSFKQRSPLTSPRFPSRRRQDAMSHSSTAISQTTSPFQYFSASDSDPMTYGYRNQTIEYCFIKSIFKFSCADDSKYTEELPWRYDDIHRLYSPYVRLVTENMLLDYIDWFDEKYSQTNTSQSNFEDFEDFNEAQTQKAKATLAGLEEWLRLVKSGPHIRNKIALLYKPFSEKIEVDIKISNNFQEVLIQLKQHNQFFHNSEYQIFSEIKPSKPLHHTQQPATERVPSLQQPPPLPEKTYRQQKQPQKQKAERNGNKNEILSKELAQVTMQCNQLCSDLMDVG